MSFIYKLINTFTNKIYIGKSKKPVSQRWARHITSSERGSNTKLHNSIRKYGPQAFTIETIEETHLDNEKEIFWINFYNSSETGYNMTRGGNGGLGNKNCVGRKYSHTTIEKMKISASQRPNKNYGKNWIITTPEGQEITIFNLKKFCNDNNLNYYSLKSVTYGNQKQHKGYKVCVVS